MRFTYLSILVVFVSACVVGPVPDGPVPEEVPVNINEHWELVERHDGYGPAESWSFESGALVNSEVNVVCRCADGARSVASMEYRGNEILVSVEELWNDEEFTQEYQLNDQGQVTFFSSTKPSNPYTRGFEYDAEGNLIASLRDGVVTTRLERDENGNITRQFAADGSVASSAEYDLQGRLIRMGGAENFAQFIYDDLGRLSERRSFSGEGADFTLLYSYNDDSTLASEDFLRGDALVSLREHHYDDLGRLVRSEFSQEGALFPEIKTYEYDAEDRLIQSQRISEYGITIVDNEYEYREIGVDGIEVSTISNTDYVADSREVWRRFDAPQKRPPTLPTIGIVAPSADSAPAESPFR